MQKIRVGINGYGTIGRRVADAVTLQPDMELVGVTANSFNYRIQIAKNERKYNIFALRDDVYSKLKDHGIEVSGNLDDLAGSIDVMVDCSPSSYGEENKRYYVEKGLKAVFQGGEKASVAEESFVSQCDYSRCLGKDYVRDGSCNTVGLAKPLHAIDKKYGIEQAHAVLIRRGADSHDHKKGPIDSIVPSLEQPSHHGPDVRTILPRLNIFTTAWIVPTTIMHGHDLMLDMRTDQFSVDDIIELLDSAPRIKVLEVDAGIKSTSQVMDYNRHLLKTNNGDMYETGVWDRSIGVYRAHGYNRLFLKLGIHQEANVIPENIDSIRAVMGFYDNRLGEEPYSQFADRIHKSMENFMKSHLYVGKDDKMEEVNPSRIITDITLNIFKGI